MRKLITILSFIFLCSLCIDHCDAQVYKPTRFGFAIYTDTTTGNTEGSPTADTSIHWGAFVLTSVTYPNLISRITRDKYLHGTVFRDNSIIGNTNHIKQIMDSGLAVVETFNFANTTSNAAIPTDTASYSTSLHSFLAASDSVPKYLTSFNEQFNSSYWQVDGPKYVNILDATVREGHKFGCLVGTGGATFDVVYMLWKYYHDNNLTDSLNWLIDASSINNITGPIAQAKIALYTTEFSYIKTSDVDFYNLHWYEPNRQDTLPTTTSKILPVLIDFLRSQLGKPVYTNETGSRNHSEALVFESMNEWKSKSPAFVCYYAGETVGELAVDNSEYYKIYLEQ